MHLFLAVSMTTHERRVINDTQYDNILVAFPYAKAMNELAYAPRRLLLDSGAFTAWTKGTEIDIAAYAEWALAMQDRSPLVRAVNLDVIPGEEGRTSTKQERINGMKQSLKNADWLRSQGLEVIEVFHQDEPKAFLLDLLSRLPADGVLGISPRNDVPVASKIKWQQSVLRVMLAHAGSPQTLPRTHGLAVTSRRMLENFPYYSVDSSTWMSGFRYGSYVNERGGMSKTNSILPTAPRAAQAGPLDATTRRSISNLTHMAESITTLWKSRGVAWTT